MIIETVCFYLLHFIDAIYLRSVLIKVVSVLGTKGYRARYKRKQVIKSAIAIIALFAIEPK